MSDELAGKTILLVDDDPDIITTMESTLSDSGATIQTAKDGNEAIQQAEQHHPDVVLLDMMLPKRSGFLVLERLKRDTPPQQQPKVIMITGNPGTRHQVYAEAQGVDKYIHKPFRMESLVDAILEVLG